MSRILRRLRLERGFALPMALVVMAASGALVVTAVEVSSSSGRTANVAKGRMSAEALANAGLNNALAILNNPSNNALQQSTLPSTEATASSQVYTGSGTANWWGVLNSNVWTITGKGVVANPTGGSSLVRRVTASVTVTSSTTQPYNAMAWNYVMSTATGSPCDQTIANGPNTGNPAEVATRLYVFGNLCIGTSAGGIGYLTGGPLQVRGKVTINEGSSRIGSAAAPVPGAHIGQGCQLLANPLHTPCTSVDRVWSSPVADAVVDTSVTAPVADWAGWYLNAKPGPMQACTTTSGTPPTWDTNTTRDTSVPTVFELTPASSYTCQYGTTGELSWNATTRVLTVKGTMFIDGSAKITNGLLNSYNGQATLYLSGTFYMSDGSKLCGLITGSTCDWTNWNPNTELLGIVANGTGGQNPAGVSIWLYNALFQGGLYGTGAIRPEGSTQTQGPMIASEVQLGYNVSTGSQVAAGFPIITTIPAGFPGVPNTYAQPQPPVAYSG
jgi:Tfp pilus assembly protein PilX